jgi:YgiT-type zinc finger domain-containing protein
MKFSTKQIHCDFCEIGITETKFVSKKFKRFGQEFTFDQIEAEVCNNCGEVYLDGKTVKKIEQQIKDKMLIAA